MRTRSSNPGRVLRSAARSGSTAALRTRSRCRTGRSSTNPTHLLPVRRSACTGSNGKSPANEPTSHVGIRPGRRLQRTYAQIGGLKAQQARRRYDFAHQSTTALINTGSAAVVVEDLRVANMTRTAKGTVDQPGVNVKQKAGLNRSILDQGWTQIQTLLTYKADQAGARVIAVRPHGTSQTCHACGSTTPGQRESQAMFRCANLACGWVGNADTNAAIVIKQRGQEVALQDVEPNAARQAVKRQSRKTAA